MKEVRGARKEEESRKAVRPVKQQGGGGGPEGSHRTAVPPDLLRLCVLLCWPPFTMSSTGLLLWLQPSL